MAKDAIAASDLPAHCRRWDDRRRVWVPKDRYATAADAKAVIRKDKEKAAYKCKATSVGEHFHIGRSK